MIIYKNLFFFNDTGLGHIELSIVHRIKNEGRNDWAHQHVFTYDEAYRGLDDIQIFLDAIKAPEAKELERLKAETRRINNEKEFGKPAETLSVQPEVEVNVEQIPITQAKPIARVSTYSLDSRPAFLTELIARLKKERSGLTDKAGPTKDPYWSFSSGRSGFNYG